MAISAEDQEMYLKKHLQETTPQNNDQPVLRPMKVAIDNIKMSDIDYENYPANEFPCGIFYPAGTIVMIKAATTKGIQKFSTLNEKDFMSVVKGVNEMLMDCIKIKYPDGTIGSAIGIKDMDRLYALYLIRSLTPLSKQFLVTEKECDCKQLNKIEHFNDNFVCSKINDKMMGFFDKNSRNFIFNYKGVVYRLTCPNVGLTQYIYEWVLEEKNNNREPNIAFMKIIPYMLGFKTSITKEEIKIELDKFESMSTDTFNFLNSAVNRLLFGVDGLRKKCINPECELYVYVDTIDAFPKKISDIFLDDDAFENYLNNN